MSAARRREGEGSGRARGRAAARPRTAARGGEKERAPGRRKARDEAAGDDERPRGRSRARSSREQTTPARGRREAELPVSREEELPAGVDLLREVIGDLLTPWQAPPRFTPPVDVRETAEVYEVVCELPGIAADDVDVSVQGDRLRIEGEKRWRSVRDDEFVHAVERGHGRFVRAFRLPFVADADRVEATFEDGLLRVRVAKPERGRARSIQVRGREQPSRPIEGPGPTAARELSAEVAEGAAERADEHAVESGESPREPTDASGGVQSARPPHRPKDEGPLPLERRELPRTDDLVIPHVGGRQAPVGGQGAEQTSAGGIPQPGGEEKKTPTKMKEPPGSEVESQPGHRLEPGSQSVQGLQGGGGGGHTP